MPTDSISVVVPGWRATDANDQPIAGAKLKFYVAGTSTPKTVYSDYDLSVSLGSTVTCDAEGYPTSDGSTRVIVYTGTAAYKIVCTTSADVTVWSHDNVRGASVIPTASTSALPTTPVVSKTAAYTITTSDRGKLISANPTGGSFALTLPSAVTAGDNFRIGVKHAGTANKVTLLGISSQTIAHSGGASTAKSLTGYGETMWLVSNGANWLVDAYVPPLMTGVMGVIKITDRLTAPPSSPTAGARYLINGTPTGAWATLSFADKQVVEADGNGSWFAYTPQSGWLAWIDDEDLISAYYDGAWTDWSNVTAPATSTLKHAVYSYTQPQNTGGGTITAGAWTTYPLNTEDSDAIGASIASNQITLPTGSYVVRANVAVYYAYPFRLRLRNVTTGAIAYGNIAYAPTFLTTPTVAEGVTATLVAPITVAAATEVLVLEYYATNSGGVNSSLGNVMNLSGITEKYGTLEILSLTAIQGPAGAQGVQGSDGLDAAYPYQWSTSTSGDPGSGKIAGNNATIASITQIAVSETDSAGGSMAAVIATWDDSTSSNKALVKISKEGATQNFHAFRITGAGTDQGSYWTFPVSYVSTSGTIANADNCAVLVVEKGDKGDTGTTGATGSTGATGATGATGPNTGLDYAFNTATSGDPGSGKVLFNNATPASVTSINISKTGRNSESLGTLIGAQDDSTNTAHRGHLRIFTVSDRTKFIEVEYTSTFTDNSTYWTIPVSSVSASGSLPANNDVLAVMFERTGNKGADGAGTGDVTGPSASADGEQAVFSGTSGKTLRRSNVVVGLLPAWGCAGDNTTDDTTAINAVLAAGHPVVDGAGKTYRVTGAITVPAGVELRNVHLRNTATSGIDILKVNTGVRLSNVKIQGSGTTGVTERGIAPAADNVTNVVIDAHCEVWNLTVGVHVRPVSSVSGARWQIDGLIHDIVGVTGNSEGYGVLLEGATGCNLRLRMHAIKRHAVYLSAGAQYNTCYADVNGCGNYAVQMFSTSGQTETSYNTVYLKARGLTEDVANQSGGVALIQKANYNTVTVDIEGSATTRYGVSVEGSSGGPYPTGNKIIDGSYKGQFIGTDVIRLINADRCLVARNVIHGYGTTTAIATRRSGTNGSTHGGSIVDNFIDGQGQTIRGVYDEVNTVASYVNDNIVVNNGAGLAFDDQTGGLAIAGVTTTGTQTLTNKTLASPVITGGLELGASDTTLSRSAAGELAVEGTVVKKVGKETIWIPAAAMTARTTNGAAAGTVETTTNKIMFSTLDFDTTTQEFAQFAIRMPKSWNEGTVTAAFTWSHPSTSTNFGVVWALEAVSFSDDDAGDAAFGTAQQVADTGGTTNDVYVTSATSAITIAGSPAAEDWVVFQVKRVPSDGSDTMAVDARLHGVTLYFTTDASTDA